MSRFLKTDRVLIGASAAWLTTLWCAPALHDQLPAFTATVAIIAVNTLVSVHALTCRREVLVALNCVQIALFGTLNYQLCCTFGADHYRFDRPPRFYDWIEFTLAHVLRAADFLDAIDEYGIIIQNVSHSSIASGVVLVSMHLAVDVFLIGLGLRWLKRYWPDGPRETYLVRGRRAAGWLLATLTVYVVFAVSQPLAPIDWLLWPLENLLRLLDVGDMFQLFGWRLHGVEPTAWTRAAALAFRIVAGYWMARVVIHARLTLLRTWGLGVDQLVELLDDPDADVRRGAAFGLGLSGAGARAAADVLADGLHDIDPRVRRAAAWALGQIGPAAHGSAARLIDAAWLGDAALRLAAIDALGRIGPCARSAAYALVMLRKVCDAPLREPVSEALARIAPGVPWQEPEVVPKSRGKAWQKACAAATAFRAGMANLRTRLQALIQAGDFDDERDLDGLCAILAEKGHSVAPAQLFEPLLHLMADGMIWRRRSHAGRWLYSARRKPPRVRLE
jgi:HEAT repeats